MDALSPIVALRNAAAEGLLPLDARIMVACSGGLDSSVLAHAAQALRAWKVTVVTVDHGLHPESCAQARFVVERAEALGLEAVVLEADAQKIKVGQGPEDAARRERYRLLELAAAQSGVRHVLTAHNADDQAETLLMRMALGAGTRGLAGIPPRRGIFVRPLLACSRAALLAYARDNQIDWIQDPTNLQTRFLRNRLRAEARPGMAKVFGEGWVEVAARTARTVRGDLEALDFLLGRWRDEAIQTLGDGVALRLSGLDGAPPGLQRLLLRDALEEAARRVGAPPVRDLSLHVGRLEQFVQEGGRGLELPAGMRAECDFGRLRIRRAPDAVGLSAPESVRITEPGRYSWGGLELVVEPVPELPEQRDRAEGCVSAKAAPFPWVVRRLRAGERFRPFGAPGAKRVARLWTDARVPRGERADLPVIEADQRLVWVAGLRVAHAVRVRPGERAFRLRIESEPQKGVGESTPRA